MSDLAFNHRKLRKVSAGQTGRYEYHGIAKFTTTGATVKVNVGPLTKIESVVLTPLASYNANDRLSVNNTVSETSTGFVINRPDDGDLVITRNTSGTSGLAFAFHIIGY